MNDKPEVYDRLEYREIMALKNYLAPCYICNGEQSFASYSMTAQRGFTRRRERCWRDDEELYAVLPEGYTPPTRDSAVELKNCERFIASRQNPKTECVSPEREIETLKETIAQAAIPLEVLYATECDDAAIALSAEIKSEIKNAVLAIRSALLNKKESQL